MPGMKVIFPHVAGSDVSGVVRAIGSEVSGTGFGSSPVQVGDEVVVHPGISCRTCDMCVSGQEFFCRQFRIWGFQTGPERRRALRVRDDAGGQRAAQAGEPHARGGGVDAAGAGDGMADAGLPGQDPARRERPDLGRRRRAGRDGDPDLPAVRRQPDPGGRRRREGRQGRGAGRRQRDRPQVRRTSSPRSRRSPARSAWTSCSSTPARRPGRPRWLRCAGAAGSSSAAPPPGSTPSPTSASCGTSSRTCWAATCPTRPSCRPP